MNTPIDKKYRLLPGFTLIEIIVAIAGDMLLMPGLGKVPAAENMRIDDEGNISGLF